MRRVKVRVRPRRPHVEAVEVSGGTRGIGVGLLPGDEGRLLRKPPGARVALARVPMLRDGEEAASPVDDRAGCLAARPHAVEHDEGDPELAIKGLVPRLPIDGARDAAQAVEDALCSRRSGGCERKCQEECGVAALIMRGFFRPALILLRPSSTVSMFQTCPTQATQESPVWPSDIL